AADRLLQRRIIWELADFAYRWRQWQRRRRLLHQVQHRITQTGRRIGRAMCSGWGRQGARRLLSGASVSSLAIGKPAGGLAAQVPTLSAWLQQAIEHFFSHRAN
ncbi:hypothetical protein, partial [Haemophilus parainfluenzae]|uniref:hypothetical protein n=1 Tax=Haemophilus parainfluenzae TaxID=729 RepID=UPI001CEC51C8